MRLDHSFAGRIKGKVGAVQLSYGGQGTVTRDERAGTMLLDLTGAETRDAGTATAKVTAALSPALAGTPRARPYRPGYHRPTGPVRPRHHDRGRRPHRAAIRGRLEDLLREGVPSAATAGTAAPSGRLSPAGEPEAVDLGAAAPPVLLKKVAVPAAAVVVTLVLVRLLGRRHRS